MSSNEFNLVRQQNLLLQSNIQNLNEIYSTDESQGEHIEKKYKTLQNVNYYLFLIYCGFFLVMSFFIYNTTKMSWYMKILLLLCFALYPFVIYYIENGIYTGIMNLYTL
jgi:hypothetical protein